MEDGTVLTQLLYHPWMRHDNILICVCLFVGLLKLHFWCGSIPSQFLGQVHLSRSSGQGQFHMSKTSVYVQCSFGSNLWKPWPINFIFGTPGQLGQGRVSRSWGQGQGHTYVTKYTRAGGLPSTERQSFCKYYQLERTNERIDAVLWLSLKSWDKSRYRDIMDSLATCVVLEIL